MIELKKVTKKFGSNTAVDEVSLSIGPGEIVGLLGPNGAGKTTTMRLLTGYLYPDNGEVLVDERPVAASDPRLRDNIGYLPENNPLYLDIPVHEYLDFVAEMRRLPDKKEAVYRAVAAVNIVDVFHRPIGELSKGYRQRVGLAQAIVHDPRILILDEPTEGLDPNQRVEIKSLIRELGQERTVILSTHVLQEAEDTCDRVIIMDSGRIAADSPIGDVLSSKSGGRVIEVELRGDEIQSGLRQLPGVAGLEIEKSVDGFSVCRLRIDGDADIRAEIFETAKRRGWELRELHAREQSLESVFSDLTLHEADKTNA